MSTFTTQLYVQSRWSRYPWSGPTNWNRKTSVTPNIQYGQNDVVHFLSWGTMEDYVVMNKDNTRLVKIVDFRIRKGSLLTKRFSSNILLVFLVFISCTIKFVCHQHSVKSGWSIHVLVGSVLCPLGKYNWTDLSLEIDINPRNIHIPRYHRLSVKRTSTRSNLTVTGTDLMN